MHPLTTGEEASSQSPMFATNEVSGIMTSPMIMSSGWFKDMANELVINPTVNPPVIILYLFMIYLGDLFVSSSIYTGILDYNPCPIGSLNDTPESSGRAKISRSTESVSEGEQKDLKQEKGRLLSLLPLEKAVHEPRSERGNDLRKGKAKGSIKQDVVLLTKTLSWQGRRSPPCTPRPGSHRIKRARATARVSRV